MYLWCVELQLYISILAFLASCDLLTKCIFDVLSYNIFLRYFSPAVVVICLQNVSLMCWVTTSVALRSDAVPLWFAYKMYLWCVELQLKNVISRLCFVVICLQNVSLMCWVTTIVFEGSGNLSLWFAYKMYLWCVELQPTAANTKIPKRCDLLTKCIFDVLSYNVYFHILKH